MTFPALLDTNVLFSATLTDTLLRLAEQEAFRPLWSRGILDELREVLVREAGLPPASAERRIAHMRAAFPVAEVTAYESIVDSMTCDPKDRHVLAAAVRGGAEVLVTFNLGDFPEGATAPHDVAVVNPDSFLLDQLDLYPRQSGAAACSMTRDMEGRCPLLPTAVAGRYCVMHGGPWVGKSSRAAAVGKERRDRFMTG